tara:strand:+ start:17157 stop:17423 length:267 start_codon:yes stop_codon:yes gene_type:complete
MDFTVDSFIEFVALLAGLIAGFIRFNLKTQKNTLLIVQLEKDVAAIKMIEKENYTKLENKIIQLESDIKKIATDIGEIKGYLKRLNKA